MTQIQHEQLKPCPFCGDADALRHSMITGAVFCEGCGCEGPWAPHFDGDWNTRATVTVQDAARLVADAINSDMQTFNGALTSVVATPEMPVRHFFSEAILAYADALRAKGEGQA